MTQIHFNRFISQIDQMLKWASPVSIICNSFGLVRAFLPLMMGMVWERAWRWPSPPEEANLEATAGMSQGILTAWWLEVHKCVDTEASQSHITPHWWGGGGHAESAAAARIEKHKHRLVENDYHCGKRLEDWEDWEGWLEPFRVPLAWVDWASFTAAANFLFTAQSQQSWH